MIMFFMDPRTRTQSPQQGRQGAVIPDKAHFALQFGDLFLHNQNQIISGKLYLFIKVLMKTLKSLDF